MNFTCLNIIMQFLRIKAASYLYDFAPKETNNSIIPNTTDCYQCLNPTYLKECLWENSI